jgi:Putative ER transporter, 6TM, N-terminal
MFQASAIADKFGPQTYFVAIVAWVSFAMQPRAKFFRNLYVSIFLTCFAAAWTTLGLWCARQARYHTQGPNPVGNYNSSAAAVTAIFFFVNFYVISCFRAVLNRLSLFVLGWFVSCYV